MYPHEILMIVKIENDRGRMAVDLRDSSDEINKRIDRLIAQSALIEVPYTESIGSGFVIPGHDVISRLKCKLLDSAAGARMQAQALLAKADRADSVHSKLD